MECGICLVLNGNLQLAQPTIHAIIVARALDRIYYLHHRSHTLATTFAEAILESRGVASAELDGVA